MITRFDSTSDLIIIEGQVWSPREQRDRWLHLVLDTGATETIVVPDVIDDLGYNPRDGEAITVIRSAVGREEGYLLRVARFACLGYEFSNFRVHVHDLPRSWGIEGLIGLSFLRQFNYEIRSLEGLIRVEQATSHLLDRA